MDGLQEIKGDLKEIKADLKEISKILDKNTTSLIIHEARTTLAEKRIEKFENGVKWFFGLIVSGLMAGLIRLYIR